MWFYKSRGSYCWISRLTGKKMIKKISILIFIAFISLHVNSSSLFSNSLDFYTCTNEVAARNCKKCESEKNVTIQINVNVEKSIVIQNLFEGKKNLGGGALDKCKVIDKKNWQCGDDGSYNELNIYTKSKQSMTNGIYFNVYQRKSPAIPKYKIEAADIENYSCAK